MVPGTMKTVWDNSPHRGFHGTYRILFTDDVRVPAKLPRIARMSRIFI